MSQTVKRRPPRPDARAEARRRARRASADEDAATEGTAENAASTERGDTAQPSLLRRLILPPAAPLPGMPDPLAGFSYSGPESRRPLAAALYLLRARPFLWLSAGLVWAIAHVFQPTVFGFLASLIEFSAFIGAGYLGWQRPWLYGLAAGIAGAIAFLGIQIGATLSAGIGLPSADVVATAIIVTIIFQAAVGALAGWFGGYWRRRLAEAKEQALSDQARRRRSR